MNQLGRSQLLTIEPDLDERDQREEREFVASRGRKRSEAALVNEASQALCSGCLDRPDPDCAACGAPATVWTEAGDARHAVAWCAACHALLLSGRPATAAPLVYLTIPAPAA